MKSINVLKKLKKEYDLILDLVSIFNLVSFSIITSILNTENSKIVRCFDSIKNQSYRNFEYIVIDGDSNKKIQSLYSRYSNLITKLIVEKDNGIYDAWNKGIKLAKNDWVCFVGADDEFKKNTLKIYAEYITKNQNLDYVSSRINLIDKSGYSRVIGSPYNWKTFRHHMNVAHPGSMHSIKLFKYNKFDTNFKIAGDYEFLLRFKSNLKTGFIDKITLNMSNDGISNSNLNVLKETLVAKKKHTSKNFFLLYYEYLIAIFKWNIKRIIKYK